MFKLELELGHPLEDIRGRAVERANWAERRGDPERVQDYLTIAFWANEWIQNRDEGIEAGKAVSLRLVDEQDRREALGEAAVGIVHEFPKIRAGLAVREAREKGSTHLPSLE